MSDIVIKAEHLSKYYKLGVINNGTLFKDIQTWVALKRGKIDPHSKIGEDKYNDTIDGFWALKDLNFEIKQGDRVGIIGKNGAGKSTLLKLLSKITAPTKGCIKIRGRVAILLEVGTGFHGELTGRENIYLNGAILGMKKKEVDRKLDEIIDFSEIEKHIDTPVKRYSSGMYVRLAFAVAAHLDSEILIADEVLAVGDSEFQKKALGKMNDLSTGQGRTILFVSHNMLAVKRLCNQGILLHKGRISILGDLNDCIDEYNGIVKSSRDGKLFLSLSEKDTNANFFKLLEYSICDKNNIIQDSVIRNPDNIFILIKTHMTSINKNFILFTTILNEHNDLIWVHDIFESGYLTINDLQTGYINYKIKLPLEFLESGDYKISVSAVVHYTGWLVTPDSNSLNFTLKKKEKQHVIYSLDNHPMTGKEKPGILDIKVPVQMTVVES